MRIFEQRSSSMLPFTKENKAGLGLLSQVKRWRLLIQNSDPVTWWDAISVSTTNLKNIAIRILGLCVAASSCERNWSTFEFIHTKKRNRLEASRLNDLMFMDYNTKLHEKNKKEKFLEGDASVKFDPICLEELNFSIEWMTRLEGSSNEFAYTDEGLTRAVVEEAMRVHDPIGVYTRTRLTSKRRRMIHLLLYLLYFILI